MEEEDNGENEEGKKDMGSELNKDNSRSELELYYLNLWQKVAFSWNNKYNDCTIDKYVFTKEVLILIT